jgi:tripartite-type tricarboxylate transporter receptor subunit TctC
MGQQFRSSAGIATLFRAGMAFLRGTHTRQVISSIILSAVVFVPPDAGAQAYPTRAITIVNGFPPGGQSDTVARVVASGLTERLGQRVLVDPVTGAGGNIAADRVAKARPDGYTLLLVTGGHAVAGALFKSLPYDPVNDFQMISTFIFVSFVITVRNDSPFKNLADVIAAARARPGSIKYSSTGVGTTPHLIGELLASRAGVQMTHVPYRGGSTALGDLIDGGIDLAIDSLTVSGPQIRGGKIKAFVVPSLAEVPSLPGVPPVSATLPGFDVVTYHGIAAPRGTPQEVIDRLNREIQAVLQMPPVRERLEAIGGVIQGSSPEEMQSRVAGDVAKWSKVVTDAKIPQM